MFGVLPVDKPAGWTSRDVVNRIQRFVKPIRVGHTGTLDPLATGVLLIAVGPATRLVEFSHRSEKSYTGAFRIGLRSDTLDIEGQTESVPVPQSLTEAELAAAIPQFVGDIEQIPPKYSAISVGGRRAYDLARKGKDFEIPSRMVRIDRLRLAGVDLPDFSLDINCGTGTYIRTLGSDLAKAMGSDCVMTSLTRKAIGSVTLDRCFELEEIASTEDVAQRLLPPSVLLETLTSVRLDVTAAAKIRNGIPLESGDLERCGFSGTDVGPEDNVASRDPIAAYDDRGYLVAVLTIGKTGGRAIDGRYRSLRVFQPEASQSAPAASQPQSTSRPHNPES